MKKYSISLIWKMKIKTLRHHHTSNNATHDKEQQSELMKMWGKRDPHFLLVEMLIDPIFLEYNMNIL